MSYSSLGGYMNPLPTMYGSMPPRVRRLIVQTTGTYNNQYHRPYEPNLYGPQGRQMLDSVSDLMLRQNNKFVPGNFVSPTTSLVTQSATPEAPVFVANGWDTRKLRFYLELEVEDLAHNKSLVTYTGFTENADLSFNNAFDPRMKFFIMGTDVLRSIQRTYGNGQTMASWDVIDSSQILVNQNFSNPNNGAFGQEQIYSIQPDKVFENWENNAFAGVETDDYKGSSPVFRDGRIQLTGVPMKTNRTHNLAPSYTKDLLNSYLTTALTHNGLDHAEQMLNCAALVRPSAVEGDALFDAIKALRRNRAGGYMTLDNSFTYEELCTIDPNTPNQINPADTINNITNLHTTGLTADWTNSDRETQTASILAQSLPAYMARCGLYNATVDSTNIGTIDNRPITTVPRFHGPGQGVSMVDQVKAFIMMLDTELFPSISFGGRLGYNLHIRVDRTGETWIHLSLNGGPMIVYASPTFADSLMAPVVTRDFAKVTGLTASMDQISNRFWENRGGRESDSLSGNIRI
jgi:hypothetical protein